MSKGGGITVRGFGCEINRVLSELGQTPVSYVGLFHLMRTLLSDGVEAAVEEARRIKMNSPGDKPRIYKDYRSHLPVFRDNICGFTGPFSADYAEGAPIDFYRGIVIYLGFPREVTGRVLDTIMEKAEQAFSFVKRNLFILSDMPGEAAGRAVLKFLIEGEKPALDYCLRILVKNAVRESVRDITFDGVVNLGDAFMARVKYTDRKVALVDAKNLVSSRVLNLHEAAETLMEEGEKRFKAEFQIEELTALFGESVLREIKYRNPATALIF